MKNRLKLEKKEFEKKLNKRIKNYNQRLQQYIINPNDNNIHDIRVSIRRLETAYRILPKDIRSEKKLRVYIDNARKLFKLNAKIRDCDIICVKMESRYKDKTTDIVNNLREFRSKEVQQAIELGKEILKIPIPKTNKYRIKRTKLDKRYSKILSNLEFSIQKNAIIALGDEQKIEELHSLRKDFKKLRYSLELVSNKNISETLKNFKNLQDRLGEIHDSDIIIEYLQEIEKKSRISDIIGLEILERRRKYHIFVDTFNETKSHMNELRL